jgi:proton glutamate symport protein
VPTATFRIRYLCVRFITARWTRRLDLGRPSPRMRIGAQFTVVTLALITSMGIAGIPAASLVVIAVILAAVGLPPEGVGVLLVLDRFLDMAGSSLTVFADAACSVIVARLEGEKDVLNNV